MGSKKKWTGQRRTGPTDKEIGIRLRGIRIDADLSQAALGEAIGVSFQQIQKYEQGRNRLSLSRAIEVADVMNTSLDQLAGRNGKLAGNDFNIQRYKLAKAFDGLDSDVAVHLRRLVEVIKKDVRR